MISIQVKCDICKAEGEAKEGKALCVPPIQAPEGWYRGQLPFDDESAAKLICVDCTGAVRSAIAQRMA